MSEVGKSIRIQEQIFYAYQPHLLTFLNSEEGKYFLYKNTGVRFTDKIVSIGRNHLIEDTYERIITGRGRESVFRGTFFSRQPFTDILLPLIERGSVLRAVYNPRARLSDAYVFYAGLKNVDKFPYIYNEELLRGFNPLHYKQILEGNPRFLESTFNPAAGANSPVDGHVQRNGVNEAFSTIRGGAGTASDNTDTSTLNWVQASSTSNQFAALGRTIYCFNTASLTADAIISSAVFSLYGTSTYGGLGTASNGLHVVAATPASTSSLANSDYGQTGSTSFANIAVGSYSASVYNDFTLDSNGRNNISLTGVSKFATRLAWDLNNSFGGTWANSDNSRIEGNSADSASNKPKLTVTYTLPVAGGFYYMSV